MSTRARRSYSSTSSGRYRTARPILRKRGPVPFIRHDRTVNLDTPNRAATSTSVKVRFSNGANEFSNHLFASADPVLVGANALQHWLWIRIGSPATEFALVNARPVLDPSRVPHATRVALAAASAHRAQALSGGVCDARSDRSSRTTRRL